MALVAFSDASYSPQTGLGVYGCAIWGRSGELIYTEGIPNTQLEVMGAICAIHNLKIARSSPDIPLILHTDCQRVVLLYDKLKAGTLTDREREVYSDFLAEVKDVEPTLSIQHIAGHTKVAERTALDREFAAFDQWVREGLRSQVRTKASAK